ncbi:hypothetical protein Pcinc_043646 [Petrolisthes cinctipes]|uniref:Uncharacterized protein n=1 Tax=Petrolisthes cinctipes TaxID=88211 RepID=A0AAE1BIC8_PETCI|nr:hypothetical protein Pcinc_043646 [Petrolisthes cinctipes]
MKEACSYCFLPSHQREGLIQAPNSGHNSLQGGGLLVFLPVPPHGVGGSGEETHGFGCARDPGEQPAEAEL